MHKAVLDVLTQRSLVTAEDICSVLEVLCRHDTLTPEAYGSFEPMRNKFDSNNVGSIAQAISGWRSHGSNFLWQRKTPKSWGGVYADISPIPHHGAVRIEASIAANGDASDVIAALKDWSVGLGADFGFVEVKPPVHNPARPSLFAHTRDLVKSVPEMFWGMVFGTPYVELFGKDRLSTVPAAVRMELAPGLYYIQLTERFDDPIERSGIVDAARQRAKEHLGLDAFADPRNPKLPRRAPTFSFPFNPRRPPMPTPKPRPPRTDGMEEFSSSFDLETLPPFLDKIIPLIDSGFTAQEVRQIVDRIKIMPLEASTAWKFAIRVGDKTSLLRVRVFMDDVGAPDVYFTTDATLCQRIRSAFEEFVSAAR